MSAILLLESLEERFSSEYPENNPCKKVTDPEKELLKKIDRSEEIAALKK